MKTKLIKVEDGYYSLYDSDGDIVASNNPKTPTSKKLSLKNCQAVERGYDVIDLAERNSKYNEEDWISGFLFAMNLMSDKKFSEFDITKAFEYGWNQRHFGKTDEDELREIQKRFIQSLQQTGWDVEIETIEYGLGNDEDGRPVFETRFLLDKDGCLILKRK